MLKAVGIFGGTFDPVHIGHLRTAVELREHLGLDELRLMPSARPPHREQPGVSAEHRLAMLQLAIGKGTLAAGLLADDRELRREGLSYTVETLAQLRGELGGDVALCLCIGMDSLVNLHTWQRWQALSDYAHIVVAARPGWHLPETGPVAQWLAGRCTDDPKLLSKSPSGRVLVEAMTLLPVSATQIREDLATGSSVRYLVPDAVIQYIHQHGLYKQESS
ncbi:MAG: nicotinic acid mononucleotide adenylyltransferase [Gammaproteobacteria bacterium]|nr:MAG: nicotinic acid mononucleotide adenylyltransferase [Gammaproteobacteria bacterium]